MTPFDFVRLAYVLAVVLTLIALVVAFVRGRKFDWRIWRLLAAVGILLLPFSACTPTQPTPVATAPPPPACSVTVTVNGDGSVNVNGCGNVTTAPSPSTSPSPGDDLLCTDVHVFTASFGWTGPATSVRPNNQAQPYPLCTTCTSMLTATLKGAKGDFPLAVSSGKGRPKWTIEPVGSFDIDNTPESTNNVDGYNLLVKPTGGVGTAGTVHVVLNASCIGKPPEADFKYVITAS